jgi:(1->4)-alpha-D-glucan 1-alpha-D-glucosylmutase
MHRELFDSGAYVPLHAAGTRAEHAIGFMRRRGAKSAVTVAGRLWMKLGAPAGTLPLSEPWWGDTTIDAGPLTGNLENIYTGEQVRVVDGRIRVSDAFAAFPAALLVQL